MSFEPFKAAREVLSGKRSSDSFTHDFAEWMEQRRLESPRSYWLERTVSGLDTTAEDYISAPPLWYWWRNQNSVTRHQTSYDSRRAFILLPRIRVRSGQLRIVYGWWCVKRIRRCLVGTESIL